MEAAVEAMGPAADKLNGAAVAGRARSRAEGSAIFAARRSCVPADPGGVRAARRWWWRWRSGAADLESLFDLELDTEKNQYESGQQAALPKISARRRSTKLCRSWSSSRSGSRSWPSSSRTNQQTLAAALAAGNAAPRGRAVAAEDGTALAQQGQQSQQQQGQQSGQQQSGQQGQSKPGQQRARRSGGQQRQQGQPAVAQGQPRPTIPGADSGSNSNRRSSKRCGSSMQQQPLQWRISSSSIRLSSG